MNYLKNISNILLFKKFQKPGDMLMYLKETSDKTKNNELVSMINSGLK